MKAKVEIISTLALLLVFLLFSLPQQTFGEEDAGYVYPVIETNCDQINATTYRFHPGNSLNFTCTFATQEYVHIWFLRNFSSHIEHDSPYYTSTSFARIYLFICQDGVQKELGYKLAGDGEERGAICLGYREGEHPHKIIYLFQTYGDFDGFYELNFLTEPKFKIEKAELPTIPTVPLLITGGSGAAIAFAISAVIWHKKNSAKKEENNVNP